MRRLLFTFLVVIFAQQNIWAEDIEVPNFRKGMDYNISKVVNDSIKQEQQNKIEIPAVNEKRTTQPIQTKSAIIKTNINEITPSIELNDRVYNYSLMSAQMPADTIIYSQSQRHINAINPQKENNPNANYPGLRGPNQLIVYTPSFGERTGTNEFGTEAIIENNMVVSLNGADSIIPQNGFVISGHGNSKNWILKNIQVGSKVYIDYFNNELYVYLTPESLIYAAKSKMNEVNYLVNYYKHSGMFYNNKKTNEYIDDSMNLLKKAEKKPEKAQTYISEAMALIDNAYKNAIPYNSRELKGIWLRPYEQSPEQIEHTIKRIHEAGITDIFLETYYHGKTIYPSAYLQSMGVIPQREEFAGFDPLAVWIQEAHKRNMKIHIWFESFYVGNDNPKVRYNHVLNVHPDWTNKRFTQIDAEGPMPCASEHNGYFLDPANPQVKSYLIGLIQEIVDVYHPDGINLDYIRYPQSVETSYSNYVQSNWGYTPYAREEFMGLYGVDPVEIKYGTNDWDLWALYRQNKVTDFLQQVQAITKDKHILLTAVIFPDLYKSKSTKMQNWKVWSMSNFLDGLTPLILTGDKNTAELLMSDVFRNIDSSTNVYPGIFVTFMGGSFEDLLMQIHKTREYKAKGAVLFDYAHLYDKYSDALKTRIYNPSYDDKDVKIRTHSQIIVTENDRPKRKSKRNRDIE